VYSLDPNVDAAGACIGQNGSRIQKIVAQLGNAKDKEKIDIIAYTENKPLYLVESLKPAQVTGIIYDEDNKKATMIIADDNLGTAIGRRGVNPRLASKLTGYTIEIKDLTSTLAEGLTFKSVDALRTEDDLRKQRDALPTPTGAVRLQASATQHDESYTMEDVMAPRQVTPTVEKPILLDKETSIQTASTDVVKEVTEPIVQPTRPVVKPTPVVEAPKVTVVRTTKTLEELEKELDQQKAKPMKTDRFDRDKKKKPFKKRDRSDDKPQSGAMVPSSSNLDPAQFMKIYDDETPAEEGTTPAEPVAEEPEVELEDFDEYYDEEK
jgi:hypothetical protein